MLLWFKAYIKWRKDEKPFVRIWLYGAERSVDLISAFKCEKFV